MSSAVFEHMTPFGYEQVAFCHDRHTGLRAIIAIHNTTLGPGLGGTRFYPYPDEQAALFDAVRLARAMTYKNAAAGLDYGGGKAVIIGNPAALRSETVFRAYGRFVHSLNGRYVTATDIGTSRADMDLVREETPFVTDCLTATGARSGRGWGDTSSLTGLTVYLGMKAAAKHAFGTDALAGRRIAVQGAGKIGHAVMGWAHGEGAELLVADPDVRMVERAVKEFGARPVDPTEVVAIECDILSPCALGGVLNEESIPRVRAKVIAGGANNQLLDESRDGEALEASGIVYAPDFIVNCGGVINVADQLEPSGYSEARAEARSRRVYDTTERVLALARREGISTAEAANRYAEERMEALTRVRRVWAGGEQ
jgi:leucine dehydrogenase